MTLNTTVNGTIYRILSNNFQKTTETMGTVIPGHPVDSTKIAVNLETTKVSTNLAILPVLAILIFLTCVCLKCCSWFRDSIKDRDEGDVENSGFIILNEGDNEYRDVEFRSDTNSCYDTVSSYTSFIRRNNQYDTVTSVRSLQTPRQWDAYNTYNSYRSYLLQRLDGSKYNTVNSVRSLLRNASEMKDAEVQVELVDPVQQLTKCKNSERRHNSIDAIPLHNRSSTESGTNEEIRQHRNIKRGQRHRVSFVDSKSSRRFVDSRSMSVDNSHSPLADESVRKSSHSLKQLWGIRDNPRNHPSNKYSPPRSLPKRPSPQQNRLPQLVDAATSPTMDHTTPNRKHRFKVTKADESQLPTLNTTQIDEQNQKHCSSECSDQNIKITNSTSNTEGSNIINASCEHHTILRDSNRHALQINEHIKANICDSQIKCIVQESQSDCGTSVDMSSKCEEVSTCPHVHSNKSKCAQLPYEKPSKTSLQSNEYHNPTIKSESNTESKDAFDVSKTTKELSVYSETCSPGQNQIDDEDQDVGFCSDDTDSGVCNELTAFLNEEDTRL